MMGMDIPEKAVEEAAKAVLRGTDAGHHAYKIAYAALEAAAPHMLADAWDEGEQAGRNESCSRGIPSSQGHPQPLQEPGMTHMVEHTNYPGVFYDPSLVYIHTGDAVKDAAHRLMMAEHTYCIPQTVIIGAFTVSADSANP